MSEDQKPKPSGAALNAHVAAYCDQHEAVAREETRSVLRIATDQPQADNPPTATYRRLSFAVSPSYPKLVHYRIAEASDEAKAYW